MQDIEQRVKKVISEQLFVPVESLAMEATFGELGADSLETVELVMALEDEFHFEISDEAAESITNVQQAVDYATEHGQGQA